MRSAVLSIAFLAASVLAVPSKVFRRQSATTCGNNYYTQGQVSDAFNQGYNDYEDGNDPDNYPHEYKNYEGFNFPVSGPYQEFPILESGVFTGGSPGADRVIFNEQGQYAGAITHTGASSYDGFVGCSGTS